MVFKFSWLNFIIGYIAFPISIVLFILILFLIGKIKEYFSNRKFKEESENIEIIEEIKEEGKIEKEENHA